MKNGKDVVGFEFQVIPLDDAKSLAIAGSGNYSDLKAKLLQELPNLQPDQAFCFGLPKGEVPEDQRRGIVLVLNATLKKAKLPWKITYSGVRKLFVCVPPNTPRNYEKKNGTPKPKTANDTMKEMIKACGDLFHVNPEDIKNGIGIGKQIRKAVCVIAHELGVSFSVIAPHVGLKKGGVRFNTLKESKFATKEIAALRKHYGR